MDWKNARAAIMLAGAAAFALAAPARAEGIDLLSPDTILVTGDARLVAADGEQSWVEGGFGKLRFGGRDPSSPSGGLVRGALSGDLVWQPKFGWAFSATVVGLLQQRDKFEAGLSEAYVSFRPLGHGTIKFSARAGLMWPPVSLEHGGPEWSVRDTITPSAINSWIGEEVKFVGAEGTASMALGGGSIGLTGAVIDADDTAGALLAYRGWALHDLKAVAWRPVPLPELGQGIEPYQPYYTHPMKEMDGGFLKRPGWYARAVWQLAVPVRIDTIHYDNGGDPEASDINREWGWRTRFNNVGLTASLGPATDFRAQAMAGHTLMGFYEGERRLVDMRFRSAFALLTQRFGERDSIALRGEGFATRNHGSELVSDDDEHGWAMTAAGKRQFGANFSALIELLHVDSSRAARARNGLAPHQRQTQLQTSLRLRW